MAASVPDFALQVCSASGHIGRQVTHKLDRVKSLWHLVYHSMRSIPTSTKPPGSAHSVSFHSCQLLDCADVHPFAMRLLGARPAPRFRYKHQSRVEKEEDDEKKQLRCSVRMQA